MGKTRRTFLGTGSAAAITGLAGCLGGRVNLAAKVGLASPAARSSHSTTAEKVAVKGQPTVEDGVPAAWGAIAHTPDELETLVDWDALINSPDGPADGLDDLKDFDVEGEFVTATVGVLPYGDALVGVTEGESDIHFEGNTVRNEVTNYQAFEPEPDSPQSHYDYTITLWDLNGVQEPDSIKVNFHE